VKVDETDIVNVHLSQIANISIDAIPNRTFKGHVIEIGNTAILRSTGLAASQSANSSRRPRISKSSWLSTTRRRRSGRGSPAPPRS